MSNKTTIVVESAGATHDIAADADVPLVKIHVFADGEPSYVRCIRTTHAAAEVAAVLNRVLKT